MNKYCNEITRTIHEISGKYSPEEKFGQEAERETMECLRKEK